MALPYAYPSTRRAQPADTTPARWRLFGAEVSMAVVVAAGPAAVPAPSRFADRGVLVTRAAAGAVIVGSHTRLVAVQPSITSW